MFIWTLSDALAAVAVAFVLIVAFAVWLHRAAVQWWCKHDHGVVESRACDAICVWCGKNLGFIGAWRDKQRRGEGPRDE